jgi:hypothetical protein
MSDSEKPRRDPEGTIQLDRVDSDAAEEAVGDERPARSSRKTPPPLPAFAQQAPLSARPAPSRPPPARRRPAKIVAYLLMFAALLAAAILGGRSVGSRSGTPPAITTARPTAAAAPSAPPGSTDSVLMVPTIEMK